MNLAVIFGLSLHHHGRSYSYYKVQRFLFKWILVTTVSKRIGWCGSFVFGSHSAMMNIANLRNVSTEFWYQMHRGINGHPWRSTVWDYGQNVDFSLWIWFTTDTTWGERSKRPQIPTGKKPESSNAASQEEADSALQMVTSSTWKIMIYFNLFIKSDVR